MERTEKPITYLICKKGKFDKLKIKKFIRKNKLKDAIVTTDTWENGYVVYRIYKNQFVYNLTSGFGNLICDFTTPTLFSLTALVEDHLSTYYDYDFIEEKYKTCFSKLKQKISTDFSFAYFDDNTGDIVYGNVGYNTNTKIYVMDKCDEHVLSNSKDLIRKFGKDYYLETNDDNTFCKINMSNEKVKRALPEFDDKKQTSPVIQSSYNESVRYNEKYFEETRKITKETSKFGTVLNSNIYSSNPAIGRDEEVRDLEKYLTIPKKGVILVGKTGVGKTSIVEGLAYKIQSNEVCNLLKSKKILSVRVNELLAGCQYRGTFEKKIQELCEYASKNPNIVLFIDEIHTVIGAGTADGHPLDLANILKPYISSDNLKVIGCTTTNEFDNINSDLAFRRRFNIIPVEEPTLNTMYKIIENYVYNNDFNIDVVLTDEQLFELSNIIVKLSKRVTKYNLQANNNPDASINILTHCFAYFAVCDINEATYDDFIDGIKDNKNLGLTEIDLYTMFKTEEKQEIKVFTNTKLTGIH